MWHRPLRRPAVLGAALSLLVLTACSGPTSEGPAEDRDEPVRAACPVDRGDALAPADGAYLGVTLDWESETLEGYAERAGVVPAYVTVFVSLPMTDENVDLVDAVADQAAAAGSGIMLTLEPHEGLAAVDDDALTRLGDALARWNEQGVPVIARFAHEMNGSWFAWGQDPEAYVATFGEVAEVVRAAPASATMWAPTYAAGYPFRRGEFSPRRGAGATAGDFTPERGDERLAALDTDGDGRLTAADDPYAPYYPGDEAVDWVGLTLMHWGNDYPWEENQVPTRGKLVDQLRGSGDTPLPDFHAEYGEARGKPVALTQTAALFMPAAEGADELAVKRAWWRQTYAPRLLGDLTELGMVTWLEWDRPESEVADEVVEWAATDEPEIAEAYRADLPSWGVDARTC